MLYREIIAVCSQIHTEHINTLCGQNVGLLHVKAGGTYSDRWALRCYNLLISAYAYVHVCVCVSAVLSNKSPSPPVLTATQPSVYC